MPEKPLVEGRGVLRLWQVADLTGIREHDVAALVESGAIVDGLVDKDGRAFGIFEDEVPSRDLLLTLGAHAIDDSVKVSLRGRRAGVKTGSYQAKSVCFPIR